MKQKTATLVLEDGSHYEAFHFGAPVSASGEIVFNTAMTGYTESLTDPSYRGQLLVYTYPLIGNYGIPISSVESSIHNFYESDRLHIVGLIVSDYTHRPHHWNMSESLSDWLEKHYIPALYGLDTRALTQKLREQGTMLGKIIVDEDIPFYDPNQENLAAQVSIEKKTIYGDGQYKVLLVDCGVKNNIIRCLLHRDCTVIRVPWAYNFTQEDYDGLFISNGPGDPKVYQKTVAHIRSALQKDQPIFGICLGNQLLGLAAGGDTHKLKYGHRSHNQPVLLVGTDRAFITSQNHGYVLDPEGMGPEWKVFFKNLNDESCEGIIHDKKPFFSAQFHPEASGGPTDTEFLFDNFITSIKRYKKANPLSI
ncbi:MAG: glutamine-hydrolyzing carbamoyl-phosphate synthase small subunit [Flavobacteriales bacterium Tduv]